MLGPPAIDEDQLLRSPDQPLEVPDLCHRCPGAKPLQEQNLRAIESAESRQIALVEEGLADRAVRLRRYPAHGLRGIPVWAQQIGSEVTHDLGLLRRCEQLDHGQPVADGVVLGGRQDAPNFERGAAGPSLRVRKDPPDPVHPEVRVQREVVVEPEELMLAAGNDLAHHNAGQIRCCQ